MSLLVFDNGSLKDVEYSTQPHDDDLWMVYKPVTKHMPMPRPVIQRLVLRGEPVLTPRTK